MAETVKLTTNVVTVAHISSESGDHFLEHFEGELTADEISEEVYLANPDWWTSADDVNVEDIQVYEFVK